MNRALIIEKLLNESKNYGFDDGEILFIRQRDFETAVYENEIDKYSLSESLGLSFRGLKNDKIGYAYTEKIDEASVDLLLKEAMANLDIIDSKDQQFIYGYQEADEYVHVNQFNEGLTAVDNQDKIELLKALESAAYAYDSRVTTVNHCLLGDGYKLLEIKNTKGIDLEEKSNLFYVYLSVGVKEDDDVQSGYSVHFGNDFSTIDTKKMVSEAVEKALGLLGASSVKSDNYPVVIENRTFADLLQAYSSIFSAEAVQKNMSLLKGKLHEKIGVSELNIIDNPHLPSGIASRSFDAEGLPTKKKALVKEGQLMTYLHNLKTAHKEGVQSTGNAVRSSYKSSVGIAPSNLYIKPGKYSATALLKEMDEGLLITSLAGLHSGINPVSGDFSLAAKGYLIQNGMKKRPVNQITISGNFLKLINNVQGIGNDLKFTMPSGSSIYGSPSILVNNLTISGQ